MKEERKPANQPNYKGESVRLNDLIRRAALTVDPQARISAVAKHARIGAAGIRVAIRRGFFTVGQAAALELAFGRDLLPKEALCREFSNQ